MDAYDFVITVLAFSPKYSKTAEDRRVFDSKEFYKTIMGCPEEFLDEIEITSNIFGNSETLNEALKHLNHEGFLKICNSGRDYKWDFPLTPEEHFKQIIEPSLKEGEFSKIEKIVNNII